MFVCFLRKFKHQLSVCFLRKKKHIRSKSSSSSIGKSNHVFGCIPIFLAKARTSLVILTPPKTTLLQIQFRFHLRSERVGVHDIVLGIFATSMISCLAFLTKQSNKIQWIFEFIFIFIRIYFEVIKIIL